MKKVILASLSCASLLMLTSCAESGYENRPDVYNAGMVNQVQEVANINIIQVRPVRIQVSNARNRSSAGLVGGLLGAGLGVGMGLGVGHSPLAAGLGGFGGAVAGDMIGHSIAGSTSFVNGVTVVFQTPTNRMMSSTQVGRACEYALGIATVVATGPGQIRIQPNATCVPNPY